MLFPVGTPFDGPDNITVGSARLRRSRAPTARTTSGSSASPTKAVCSRSRFNALNDQEFAGATFSPDGRTLFVNIQDPGLTYAIWGPWTGEHDAWKYD